MGHFKHEAWATGALTVVQGRVQADLATIQANFNGSKPVKGSKTQLVFMMDFTCPPSAAVAAAAASPRRTKTPRRSEYRVAIRYLPPPMGVNFHNFYSHLIYHMEAINGRTVPATGSSSAAGASVQQLISGDELKTQAINYPFCQIMDRSWRLTFCEALGGLEPLALAGGDLIAACTGAYPSSMQGLVDESMSLGEDSFGNALPGPLADLRQTNNGALPKFVDPNLVEAELATLYWLFDKTQQLGPWAACDNGQVKYALKDKFAPGFGPTTLYYVNNTFENVLYPPNFLRSNFSRTAFAQSAVSTDGLTMVIAIRGTRARSEWIADMQYNQVLVTDEVLVTNPLLRPFYGMGIHFGFTTIFEQIYEGIWTSVVAATSATRIIVTGHSLGGGLTQLVALAIAKDLHANNLNKQVDAAMFAPPTAGNQEFANAFNQWVNGRRVAYTSDTPGQDFDPWLPVTGGIISTHVGDIIGQVLCPDTFLCKYNLANFKENYFPISTTDDDKESNSKVVHYIAVGGNVQFDYSDLPISPYTPNNPTWYRQAWGAHDTLNDGGAAHICSYPCFLSSTLNVQYNKCILKKKVTEQILAGHITEQEWNAIPPNVTAYGLCML